MEYIVSLDWDEQAQVWLAESSAIPLALSSGSMDALIERTRYVAAEVLAENGKRPEDVYLNFAPLKRREKVYI